MHTIKRLAVGLCPNPLGSSLALPRPPSWIQRVGRPLGMRGKGRRGKGGGKGGTREGKGHPLVKTDRRRCKTVIMMITDDDDDDDYDDDDDDNNNNNNILLYADAAC